MNGPKNEVRANRLTGVVILAATEGGFVVLDEGYWRAIDRPFQILYASDLTSCLAFVAHRMLP